MQAAVADDEAAGCTFRRNCKAAESEFTGEVSCLFPAVELRSCTFFWCKCKGAVKHCTYTKHHGAKTQYYGTNDVCVD